VNPTQCEALTMVCCQVMGNDVAVNAGIKLFVGGNCSITLSLMGLAGLIKADIIEWMSVMTYQSASGAGAKQVRELI
ncbi:Asd/ArgC dimerization domain-containing protein, partial [Klebsiella pneumoniae]|uniref:Asd/ArgC dimerization domain-containing protein n=1 Tax=Klebsiella pneumoniae TaxID=573 RepID=UPI00272FA3E4